MIEVLKQALEALEKSLPRLAPYGEQDWLDSKAAIASLRQAIAGLESQEPVSYSGNGTAGRENMTAPTGFFFQMPKESQEPVVTVPRRLALNTWAFLAQDCSPCAHKECQIGLKNVGVDTLTDAWNKQLAGNTHPPQRTEQNFCPRCGKRTNDIHTCTLPRDTQPIYGIKGSLAHDAQNKENT